ncbi:MAG TPA: cytochrome P450 [Microthrixaceae bacterium]|nr:cytochrome P450 [Microthrixaceae bacterium]
MHYDPFASDIVSDPYPVYEWLREEHPVYYAGPSESFVLTRYDDVTWALGDTDLFSSDAMRGVLMGQPTGKGEERLPRDTPGGSLVSFDPPAHSELRKVVNRGFTPRRINAWDNRIAEIVQELMADAPEDLDVVERIAAPLPVQVITELLGADSSHARQFRTWADATTKMMSGSARNGDVDPAGLTAAMELVMYLTEYIEARSEDPGGDLIGTLLRARDDEVLSSAETVAFAGLLLFAGTETTTNLIGNAVWALDAHRDDLEAVIADETLLPGVIEETLRWESPVQYVFRRATRPFALHGTDVPVDSWITLLIGAANRDPRRFGPDADAFDPRREAAGHVAFGFGPHFCLGAALARSETMTALEAVLPLVASARTVDGGGELIDSMQFRGRQSLRLVS